jgi:serine/threonine protein kinase
LRDEKKIPIPVETSIKSFQSLFAIYFQITYNYYQRYDQFLESITKINSNKYELKFTEQKIISSDHFWIVCKAVENESKNEFTIRKIPVSEDQLEKIIEEIKKFEKLWAKCVVNCSDFWIEENYFLRKNFKLDKKSNLKPSHDIFNPNNSILLHIQMELCYKTMSETIQILNTELSQNKYEIMSSLGYYIASEIFIELLECIKYLLEKNINPRALKPENILITCGENGRFVKFADFGLDTIHVFEEQSHPKDSKIRINIKPEAMDSKLSVKKIDLDKCHEFEGQSHSKDTKTKLYSEIEVKDSKYFDLKFNIDIFVSIIQDLFNIDINK